MSARLEELEALLETNRGGGGPKYVERHRERGKLLVRERIELLLDRDSPFLELQPFIAHGTDYHVGGSIVTGHRGRRGRRVRGQRQRLRRSAAGPTTPTRCARRCARRRSPQRNRLPLINLVESGGADLPTQADAVRPRRRDVPQPHAPVEPGHPDDRARVRQLDRRRRLRPRAVRPHRLRPRPRARLPRRPAAREDGDRGGGRRRGARRRGDALAHVRPVGLPRRRRARRAAPRPRHRAPAQLAQARPGPDRGGRRAALRPRGAARRDVRRPQGPVRPAPTCSRGSSTARASTSSSRSTAPR